MTCEILIGKHGIEELGLGKLTRLQRSTVNSNNGDTELSHTPARDVQNKYVRHDGE